LHDHDGPLLAADQKRENDLQSISDITKAIKVGDEKYVKRLNVLADLLTQLLNG